MKSGGFQKAVLSNFIGFHCAPLRSAPFRMTFFRNTIKRKDCLLAAPSITSLKTLVIIFYQGARYIRRNLFLSFPLSG